MDKEQARQILSVYRAGSDDAQDPYFAEALQAAAADPDLATWFAEAQRFEAEMIALLQVAPAPAGLRDAILQRAATSPAPRIIAQRRIAFAPWLAAAAAVVAAFFIGRGSVVPTPVHRLGDGSLALQAISYSGQMPKLDFVCFSSDAVKGWVDKKSAAMHMGNLLDKPMPNMQMIGSSATEWGGKPVIQVALQNGRHMGMLYLMRTADFPGGASEDGHVMEKDGWVSKVGLRGDHVFVLTARGTRDDLNFPMPL